MSQVEYVELADHYDLINEHCIDYARQAAWLAAFLRRRGVRDGLLLDIACGTGQHAVRLREAGHRVIGLDASAHLLRIARRKGRIAHAIVADMRRIPLARQFDAAFCLNHTINYMLGDDLATCLNEVARVLRPGALFVLDFFDYGPTSEWNAMWRDAVSADGVRIEMLHWMTANRAGTVATDAHTYLVTRGSATTTHRGEDHLWITRTRQMLDSLARAGFAIIERGRKPDLDMGPEACSVTVAARLMSRSS